MSARSRQVDDERPTDGDLGGVLGYASRTVRYIDQVGPAPQIVAPAASEAGLVDRALHAADGVLGPVGIAASSMAASHAVDELRRGNPVHGAIELAGSGAGLVSGVAGTSEAIGLTASLGSLAASGAGVAAAADGVKDVYDGAAEGDREKVALGGATALGGTLMTAGAWTLDPLMVAGGAAVYMGGVVYESREALGAWLIPSGRW
jgi:hypothetical protein